MKIELNWSGNKTRFGGKRKCAGLTIVFILLVFCAEAQTLWKEIWSDNFSGMALSADNWKAETGTGNNGWGNQELQFYTAEASNIEVRDGELRIIARKEEKAGRSFTSARIKTQGLRYWKYGRIEARIKLPWSKGLWPAFWMLGENIADVGWPKCGEIDIMEHVNEVPEINGTMHWDSLGRKYHGGTMILNNPQAYHLYAVEWEPEKITWFLDNAAYHTEYVGKNMASRTEFHGNYFLILNLAVGGDWPGSPDSGSIFPDTLHVDYVRVLEREKSPVQSGTTDLPDRRTKDSFLKSEKVKVKRQK